MPTIRPANAATIRELWWLVAVTCLTDGYPT